MDALSIIGITLGVIGGVIKIGELFRKFLTFGFNCGKRNNFNPIYKFKEEYCDYNQEIQAFLIIDKWNKYYVYPFESMEYCKEISNTTLYNNVVFDVNGNYIQKGGIGFHKNICYEKGKKFFQNIF